MYKEKYFPFTYINLISSTCNIYVIHGYVIRKESACKAYSNTDCHHDSLRNSQEVEAYGAPNRRTAFFHVSFLFLRQLARSIIIFLVQRSLLLKPCVRIFLIS